MLLGDQAAHADGYARLDGHGGPIRGIEIADGRALTASFDNSIGFWRLDTEALEPLWLDGHEAAANVARFLDGNRALTGGDDNDLILWDLSSGEPMRRFEGHTNKVLGLAIHPDGTIAASASWDRRIGLWDLDSGSHLTWLEGHEAPVQDVLFGDDGATLYSASVDGTIRSWDVAGRAFRAVEASHGFGVNTMVLNEAEGWLGYGALDGVVRILDLETGEEIADITSGRQPVLALTLSPDGGRIAVGDGEGFINVVETGDWGTLRDFRATPKGPVWALAFDGAARIAAGTLANHADLWPLASAEGVAESDQPFREFHRDPDTMTNGERQFFRKCSICHTLTPNGGRRAGPSLYGVFGRRAGTLDGYHYSDALDGADLVWTEETLDKLFDLGPAHYTPGSKMPMQRIVRAEDRADLIAYLKEATNGAPPPEDQ